MRAWLSLIVLTQFIVSGFAYAQTDAVPEPGKTPTLSASPDPTLGPWAIDEKGNVGRIHTVVSGGHALGYLRIVSGDGLGLAGGLARQR